MGDETFEYKAESVDGVVTELFSGKLPIAQALQQLRTRLLDLSARNRLLAYRHPKARCIQFVENPNLNLLYERLLENRNILIKPVPEPDPFSYEGGKKPGSGDQRTENRVKQRHFGAVVVTSLPGERRTGVPDPADLGARVRMVGSTSTGIHVWRWRDSNGTW